MPVLIITVLGVKYWSTHYTLILYLPLHEISGMTPTCMTCMIPTLTLKDWEQYKYARLACLKLTLSRFLF